MQPFRRRREEAEVPAEECGDTKHYQGGKCEDGDAKSEAAGGVGRRAERNEIAPGVGPVRMEWAISFGLLTGFV